LEEVVDDVCEYLDMQIDAGRPVPAIKGFDKRK
jgi:hypothetical protein